MQNLKPVRHVSEEVDELEARIREQLHSNEQLLFLLRKLEAKVQQTGKGIDELIKNNPAVIDEAKGEAIRDLQLVSVCCETFSH